MTTITQEHLELAALAAGHEIDATMQTDSGGLCIVGSDDDWMPHADIADAARLAASLQMRIIWLHDWVSAVKGSVDAIRSHDGTQSSKERAYCEAVTLCAAQIGRKMREGGR